MPDPLMSPVQSGKTRAGTHSRIRLPGLDGLRAIGALLVLIYHLLPSAMPSGFIGVDVFFVLSGFLITSLLIDEAEETTRINLPAFWLRRFRRLLPAVATASIVCSAGALAVGKDALVALDRQVIGALTGTYNWVEIAAGTAYFEQSSPLLLTNMWSLGVEQQFYLVWPLLLLLVLKLSKKQRIGVALGIGGASALAFTLLAGGNLSRAYMGTDTHLWGLMIGAALAFALPKVLRGGSGSDPRAIEWGIAGIAGLLLLFGLALISPLPQLGPLTMILASCASALVIRSLIPSVSKTGPARILARILDAAPLRWLGERSYGIYLWHWPLWVLSFYAAPFADQRLVGLIVASLCVLFGALSYRFIETPIRREGFTAWVRRFIRTMRTAGPYRGGAMLALPSLLIGLALCAIIISPERSSAARAVEDGSAGVVTSIDPNTPTSGAGAAHSDEAESAVLPSRTPDASTSGEHSTGNSADSAQSSGSVSPQGPAITGEDITVIGDSISLGASSGLTEAFPGIAIDAQVSRSFQVAPSIVDTLSASGMLRNVVIVSLATNGLVTDEDIDELVNHLGTGRALVLVTAFGPARCTWIPPANEAIHRAAGRYAHVVVADWNALIAGRTDLLADDLVHPAGSEGVALYLEAIMQALAEL